MLYIQALLTFSLEEAIQTADSMKARGYGQGARSSYEYFKFTRTDLVTVVFLTLLFLFILYGRVSGFGFLTIYPLMEAWTFAQMDFVFLGCFILYLSFPILVEAGEFFRWRILN